MTPEELEELRALAGRLSGTAYNENLAAILGAALEHIDQQATSLAATEERVREHEAHENQTHEVLGGILGTDDTLENVAQRAVDRITELEAQVAALKEIAIDQLAENNYDFEYNMESIGKYFWQRDEKFQEKFLDDARRQLAEEHPEAFR